MNSQVFISIATIIVYSAIVYFGTRYIRKMRAINKADQANPHPPTYAGPIHYKDGKWYFWDEVWVNRHGPYDTNVEAGAALKEYGRWLDHGPSDE